MTRPAGVDPSQDNGGEGPTPEWDWDLYGERWARYGGQPWRDIAREMRSEQQQRRGGGS